jgi:hypothetical protein
MYNSRAYLERFSVAKVPGFCDGALNTSVQEFRDGAQEAALDAARRHVSTARSMRGGGKTGSIFSFGSRRSSETGMIVPAEIIFAPPPAPSPADTLYCSASGGVT